MKKKTRMNYLIGIFMRQKGVRIRKSWRKENDASSLKNLPTYFVFILKSTYSI